jgi:hypothetical protein
VQTAGQGGRPGVPDEGVREKRVAAVGESGAEGAAVGAEVGGGQLEAVEARHD